MEEQIVIDFDENGEIIVNTKGIKGKACIDDVKRLLEDIATITHEHKTDEYYMGGHTKRVVENEIKVGRR